MTKASALKVQDTLNKIWNPKTDDLLIKMHDRLFLWKYNSRFYLMRLLTEDQHYGKRFNHYPAQPHKETLAGRDLTGVLLSPDIYVYGLVQDFTYDYFYLLGSFYRCVAKPDDLDSIVLAAAMKDSETLITTSKLAVCNWP